MVIGTSRYFDLSPVGIVTIDAYTAYWEMVNSLGQVKYSDAILKEDNKFKVRIQTDGMAEGGYTLRVIAVDSTDEFKDIIYTEKLPLTKV